MHGVPVVGGAIDALLEGAGARLKEERVMEFIKELAKQVEDLQAPNIDEEALQDLLLCVIERVARTRSTEKRARFARLVRGQLEPGRLWEQGEVFVRLVDELSDIHVRVLTFGLRAPNGPGIFENTPVFALNKTENYVSLEEHMPAVGHPTLRAICAELVARGLLEDVGVGNWDSHALQFFQITLFGKDLLCWTERAEVR